MDLVVKILEAELLKAKNLIFDTEMSKRHFDNDSIEWHKFRIKQIENQKLKTQLVQSINILNNENKIKR